MQVRRLPNHCRASIADWRRCASWGKEQDQTRQVANVVNLLVRSKETSAIFQPFHHVCVPSFVLGMAGLDRLGVFRPDLAPHTVVHGGLAHVEESEKGGRDLRGTASR